MLTNRLRKSLRAMLHVAALAFCAFWLVATSSEGVPPTDCFTGLGNQATLKVTLGDVVQGTSTTPKCGDLDGLIPGAVLTLALSEHPKAETRSGCYYYDAQTVQGTVNVSTTPGGAASGSPADLTSALGTFSVPQSPGCVGVWTMRIYPESLPSNGQLISPLDAGATQHWLVQHAITIDQQAACGTPFTGTGAFHCIETLSVQGITQVQP